MMSPERQTAERPAARAVGERQTAIELASFAMERGESFDEHAHESHQLAWVRDGVLMVSVGDRHWMLPPSLALWLPAETPHVSTAIRSAATMQGIYLPADLLPEWTEPVPVAVDPLLRELIDFLCQDDVPAAARAKAEALVPELLQPAESLAIEVPMPRDERAVRIADALVAEPADDRDLAEWGRHAGASARTLTRIFAAETGLGFSQWRSRLRLRASLAHLADGESVSATAIRVGFASPSAFIAAFNQLTGTTPGAYFANLAQSRHTLSD
jgi:AraC-like DNA-binding protein/quercetin dioxygenase-like cupin family protein